MNLTIPPVSLTNPRQGKLAPAAEPKLVLEWQDGPATDLGFRQQKLRLSFVRRPLQASTNLRKILPEIGLRQSVYQKATLRVRASRR